MMNRNDRYANVKIKTYDELKAYFETALFFEADTQFESLVDEIRKFNSDKTEYGYCLAAVRRIGGNVYRLPRQKTY